MFDGFRIEKEILVSGTERGSVNVREITVSGSAGKGSVKESGNGSVKKRGCAEKKSGNGIA